MADIFQVSSFPLSLHPQQYGYLPHERVQRRNSASPCTTAAVVSKIGFKPPRKQFDSFKVHAAVTETEQQQPKWWERKAGANMIDIHSTHEFLTALVQAGDRLVIVEFYGTWCASCRSLFPKLCRTAKDHPEIVFLKVNFDENKAMCKNLDVKVLPFFHIYRGGDGLLDAFSCSFVKFQKIKDAIKAYNNPVGVNIGLPNGLTLEMLSAQVAKQNGTSSSTTN